MDTILIFCAHSDDEAVGMGGTIAKLAEQKKRIIKVIFSSGEKSHPHLQEQFVIKSREGETDEASKFIGIRKVVNFGIEDTKVKHASEEKGTKKKVNELIEKFKPKKIFIPPAKDPHPDHRAVHNIVLEVVKKIRKKYPVYEYEVWNVTNEHKPMVFEDITDYYKKKVKYMKMFRSQWQYMYSLWLPVYLRSRNYGKKIGCKYAEKFYRLR
ncbi:MAG: PIG-L deacetylase family protein [Candidatus Woesearchaeota archaeon]